MCGAGVARGPRPDSCVSLLQLRADARAIPLADGCVQCCVTSPPYWGLRDYGVAGQLGLEATPDAYVAAMVGVFRDVWRSLRADGTLWLNLSDTFKDKQLTGIPWRVAFALQADGWYLRSEIIWSKPNPLPESVTDRPTKSHEQIFLLAKSQRYYFNADAVRETGKDWSRHLPGIGIKETHHYGAGNGGNAGLKHIAGRYRGDDPPTTRNVRSVWHVPTHAYPGAHFATFPEAIPERCILAGTKPGDLVLDPFSGSGTVGRVAIRLARRAVLCEINPAYLTLAHGRTTAITYGLPLEAM